MNLTSQEINKVAKLSRIKLSDSEHEKMLPELETILDIMEIMQEIEIIDEKNYSHLDEARMREDIVTDGQKREEVLKNAPESAFEMFYQVPNMIDKS